METFAVQRMTSQRRVILEELRKLNTHPTAGELYEIVRKRLPRISLGTVYRNLDFLSRNGGVLKLVVPDAPCRFDGDATDHHHVRCLACGRVADALGLPVTWAAECPKSLGGYTIVGYRLEFQGRCPQCQAEVTRKGAAHE